MGDLTYKAVLNVLLIFPFALKKSPTLSNWLAKESIVAIQRHSRYTLGTQRVAQAKIFW